MWDDGRRIKFGYELRIGVLGVEWLCVLGVFEICEMCVYVEYFILLYTNSKRLNCESK